MAIRVMGAIRRLQVECFQAIYPKLAMVISFRAHSGFKKVTKELTNRDAFGSLRKNFQDLILIKGVIKYAKVVSKKK